MLSVKFASLSFCLLTARREPRPRLASVSMLLTALGRAAWRPVEALNVGTLQLERGERVGVVGVVPVVGVPRGVVVVPRRHVSRVRGEEEGAEEREHLTLS